jgi:hypothetical protein
MKTPEAATEVFAMDTFGGGPPAFTSGFPVDLGIYKRADGISNWTWSSRFTSGKELISNDTDDESSDAGLTFDYQDGWYNSSSTYSDYISWMFKRAPGFFDVVAYDGTGSARTVSHNLGVTPELMLIKRCDGDEAWAVYVNGISPTKMLELNVYNSAATLTGRWDNTAPTSSVFTVESHDTVNGSDYTYIAYLFATLPGISKVGSYTGTGSNIDVDCGFTSGARFVMVKRTDDNGDWYVWNTERGIIAGDDPYLLMNEGDAEVTNTDYIDPLTTGFTITSSAPDALNVSGGTYIYLAIA